MDLGTVSINGTAYTVKRAIATITSGTDSDVVSAVASKAICCIGLLLRHGTNASALFSFKVRSNTADLTPALSFGSSAGASAGQIFVFPKDGRMTTIFAQTVSGEALNITLTVASGDVAVIVHYVER